MHLLLRQRKPPITCRENLQKNFIFMDLAWGLNSGLQKTFDKLVYQKIQHQNVHLCSCFLAVVACKCQTYFWLSLATTHETSQKTECPSRLWL